MGTQCEHVRRSTGGGFRCFVGARPSYAGVALVGAVDRFPLQDALGSEGCLRVANRPPRLCPPETGFLDGRLRYWRMSGAGLAHVGALDSFRGSCVSVVCRRACPLSDALTRPPSAVCWGGAFPQPRPRAEMSPERAPLAMYGSLTALLLVSLSLCGVGSLPQVVLGANPTSKLRRGPVLPIC